MHIGICHSSVTVADLLISSFSYLIYNYTSEAIIITVTASVIFSVHNTSNNNNIRHAILISKARGHPKSILDPTQNQLIIS